MMFLLLTFTAEFHEGFKFRLILIFLVLIYLIATLLTHLVVLIPLITGAVLVVSGWAWFPAMFVLLAQYFIIVVIFLSVFLRRSNARS